MPIAAALPRRRTVRTLETAARDCRACHLWRRATQTVFGEGAPAAEVMLVGEQPGNDEDLAGHPFVGPAGRILNEALEQRGSTVRVRTSPTSSNTSSGSREAND